MHTLQIHKVTYLCIMEDTIKNIIEQEFKSNGIEAGARVTPFAWQGQQLETYAVDISIGGRKYYSLRLDATKPYSEKLGVTSMYEIEKLRHHLEVITEALNTIRLKY